MYDHDLFTISTTTTASALAAATTGITLTTTAVASIWELLRKDVWESRVTVFRIT